MGEKLKAGDYVEVKSAAAIMESLDDRGCIDGLPFMPEMLAYTGRRFRVSKRAHKTCDTVHKTGGRRLQDCVHLENIRCDGQAHNGCDASCLIYWKTDWLRKVHSLDRLDGDNPNANPQANEFLSANTRSQSSGSGDTNFRCQATLLYDATAPLAWWNPRQYVEDLASGNVRIIEMLRVLFFHSLHKLMGLGVGFRAWRGIYDFFQTRIGGFRYPFRAGLVPDGEPTPARQLELRPGDLVRIKSHDEILKTLNRQKCNRGMRFDEEMVLYCGGAYKVAKVVKRIINETTGQMIEMKSPSVILDGVFCRSELSACRLFCPRQLPSYWREIWLEKVDTPSSKR